MAKRHTPQELASMEKKYLTSLAIWVALVVAIYYTSGPSASSVSAAILILPVYIINFRYLTRGKYDDL